MQRLSDALIIRGCGFEERRRVFILLRLFAGFVAAIAATMALGGCEQDPLAGQPESIRRGEPPQLKTEPEPPRPLPQEALRIDAPDYFVFKEGDEGELTIRGRLLASGAPGGSEAGYEILIENSQDFPGSVLEPVDPKSPQKGMIFRWRPSENNAGQEFSRRMALSVLLATKTEPRLAVRKEVVIWVTRVADAPEIIAVEDLTKDPLREGEERSFIVTVRDREAFDADGFRPRLSVIPSRNDAFNAAHMVMIEGRNGQGPWGNSPVQDPKDPSLWQFKLWLNAKNREITAGEDTFGFALVAHSRFGVISAARSVDAKIRTSVRAPVVSWREAVNVIEGQETIFNFYAYDPAGEGKVSVNFIDRPDLALGVASWDCPPVTDDRAPLLCTIRWKVPTNVRREFYDVPMEIRNQSLVAGDRAFTSTRVTGRFRVRPSAVPSAETVPAQDNEATRAVSIQGARK